MFWVGEKAIFLEAETGLAAAEEPEAAADLAESTKGVRPTAAVGPEAVEEETAAEADLAEAEERAEAVETAAVEETAEAGRADSATEQVPFRSLCTLCT